MHANEQPPAFPDTYAGGRVVSDGEVYERTATGISSISQLEQERLERVLRETTAKLHQVWNEMGQNEEERVRQLSKLGQEVEEVFLKKVADECALRDEYINAVNLLEKEIDECCEQVGGTRSYFPHADSGNLMIKLTWLRSHLVQFQAIKEERMVKLAEMQQSLKKIWIELGHEPEEELLHLENFLTEDKMHEYEAKLNTVQGEKLRRIAAIQEMVKDINALFEDLEYDITSTLDQAIAQGGESLGINLEAVDILSKRARKLTEEKISRTEKLKSLGLQIQPLWNKLDIPTKDLERFFLENRGLGMKVIEECERELARLEKLKHERMGELIADAQEKIQLLWDEMQYGDEQREHFTQAYMMGPINDATLAAHEEEIETLTVQADLYRPILKMVDKYKSLCVERIEYNEIIKDSSRLLTRRPGTALRDEEQKRQRVTKGIPRIIERLKTAITDYESKHGPFTLNGEPFLDTLSRTEQEYIAKIEEEKRIKLLNKHMKKAESAAETPSKSTGGRKGSLVGSRPRPPLSARND